MPVKIKIDIVKSYKGEKLKIKAGLIGEVKPSAKGYYFESVSLSYGVYLKSKQFEVLK